MIGYAFCGSYCTFRASFNELCRLKEAGLDILPIMSENAYSTDSRFFTAKDFRLMVTEVTGREIIHTITDAEPLGHRDRLESLIISPCTGNTLSKIASGITDTAVTMAAKAHLRQDGKLLLALASNDAMSQNLSNIANLLHRKSVYFLPMRQDDPEKKPHSLVANFSLMQKSYEAMQRSQQLRPLFL